MQRVEIRELERQAPNLVRKAEMPVTVDYIAQHLGIAWDTARSLLLGLGCEGKLKATKTMKSWIFERVEGAEMFCHETKGDNRDGQEFR